MTPRRYEATCAGCVRRYEAPSLDALRRCAHCGRMHGAVPESAWFAASYHVRATPPPVDAAPVPTPVYPLPMSRVQT